MLVTSHMTSLCTDQTQVAREGCNVIYITYVTRAGVALQATVENIRDFVWEICH